MINLFFRYLITPIVTTRIKIINGLENLPAKGPYLVVANHVSFLDPFLIGCLILKMTGVKVHFITNWEVYRNFGPVIGKRILGMIPIEPNNKKKCLETARELLWQNKVVGVFPEGTRIQNERLGKGKTGAARLALWTKSVVIPIGYNGPLDKGVLSAFGLFFSKKKEIKIKIGQPLDLAKFYHQEVSHELLNEMTELILKEISKLCGKKYPS